MVDDEDEKFSYDSSVEIPWESRKIHHGAEMATMDPDDEDFLANELSFRNIHSQAVSIAKRHTTDVFGFNTLVCLVNRNMMADYLVDQVFYQMKESISLSTKMINPG